MLAKQLRQTLSKLTKNVATLLFLVVNIFLINVQKFARRSLILSAEGQVIQGIVKNITNYGVFIDIGGVDGLLHITDMTWGRISHPSEMVKIGDTITVKVLSFDKEQRKNLSWPQAIS